MRKLTYLLILSAFLTSCGAENQEGQTKKYFDLKGLIEQQIQVLQKRKPVIQKTISMAEKSENQQVKSVDWAKELELFTQVDLNKPAYISSYTIDSSANGMKYVLKETEKLPVKYLTITKVGGKTTQIEALVSNENYLYQSEKHLKLSLINEQLSDYQIDGFQKVVFGDKKDFKINSKIAQ